MVIYRKLIGTLSLNEIKDLKVSELEDVCKRLDCKYVGIKKGETSIVTLWKK